jgi:hypothetical protein
VGRRQALETSTGLAKEAVLEARSSLLDESFSFSGDKLSAHVTAFREDGEGVLLTGFAAARPPTSVSVRRRALCRWCRGQVHREIGCMSFNCSAR